MKKREKEKKEKEYLIMGKGVQKMARISAVIPVTLYHDIQKVLEKESMTQSDFIRLALRRTANEFLARQLELVK